MSRTLETGAPHFKSLANQHRQSNYTFDKFVYECLDNVVKKCNEIDVDTDVDDWGKLQEVRISDDYEHGFDNINNPGVHNPFNMGHFSNNHDNDNETSEFGVGLKAGSISAANQLEVITKVPSCNANYHVTADFIRMSNEPDVNASYNPKIKTISDEEFAEIHPFTNGSTIKVTKIRDSTFNTTSKPQLTAHLKKSIGKTYAKMLERCQINVNGEQVEAPHDFFQDPKCTHFINVCRVYIVKNDTTGDIVYFLHKTFHSGITKYYIYDKNTHKWIVSSNDVLTRLIQNDYTYPYSHLRNNYCIEVRSVFTFYSDMFHNGENDDGNKPQDMVNIYKDDRLYGSESLVKHNDGNHNYTLHEISFKSKAIGKHIGITYNKEVDMKHRSNDLVNCLKAIVAENRSAFNANTSQKKNQELCDKAITYGLIDLMTCPEGKLSGFHLAQRNARLAAAVPAPIPVVPDPVVPEPVNPEPVVPEPVPPVVPEPVVPDPVVPEPVVPDPVVPDPVVPEPVVPEPVVPEPVVPEPVVPEPVVPDPVVPDPVPVINNLEERRQKTIEIIQKLSLTISTNDENILGLDKLIELERLLSLI
jgi:Histidine kinase-, DNA gyrase B-, and HSP90-like ATPase